MMRALLAFLIGLAISYFHWLGLIAGGILIALTSKNLKTAIALGFLLGVAVYCLFLVQLAANGLAEKFFAMVPLSYLSLLLAVAATTLSSALRALY